MIDPNNTHFLPADDLREHIECGTYCHCKPVVYPMNDGCVIIHQAYDGRDFADNIPLDDNLNDTWFFEAFMDESLPRHLGH